MTDLPPPHDLPDYDDLPPAPGGGRSGWGLFGQDDNAGLINLLTPQRIAAAARLVRRGALFPLDAPLGVFSPPLNPARGTPRHQVIHQPGGIGFDDVYDNLYPQASSQWDSLAHIGYSRKVYYNGATAEDILSGRRNTIDHWARHGIAGRAVLLDMERALAAAGRPYEPYSSTAFGVEDLETARRHAGVEFAAGDVLLLRTGFAGWYADQPAQVRRDVPKQLRAPGIEQSEEVARYLWNTHAAALATDTFAVEAWPADFSAQAEPFGFLHQMLIGSFGMALGELWWLDALADDCAADHVHEGFLVSAPLNAPGGIASPPNAVVIK
ncbi:MULTISPECIES: cyclase family protein [unclassified Streptomyces]|uniref:cyclase family protein n=1 Tax=unclassified Streptomyces TaxID=2593676 RepID=UPI0034377EE4